MSIPRIYLSAIRKNSGKTTISIAINRILTDKGIIVQPFKKGPDFIDPMWHSQASAGQCYNLDFFMMDRQNLLNYFVSKIKGKQMALIEGNHGLFDDTNILGGTDNAAMAKLTKSPVILIIDVKEMGRTVVPAIMGIKNFDKEIEIAGIILNRLQSKRHQYRLEKAIEYYTGIPVVGLIPEDGSIAITQRHLGLSATLNSEKRENIIRNISSFISKHIDIDAIIRIAESAVNAKIDIPEEHTSKEKLLDLNIGIAYDEAFNFYYKDNLDEIERLGAKIVKFSPLHDTNLPNVDAIYLGGGFPELFAEKLQNNVSIRMQLRKKIEEGLFVYAECGGLLYLTEDITYKNKTCDMVGIFKTHTYFTKKPKGHGYVSLKPKNRYKNCWYGQALEIRGHEFHHGYFDEFNGMRSVFNVERGYGIDSKHDGIIYKNVLANFTHVHVSGSPLFFKSWLERICGETQAKINKSA